MSYQATVINVMIASPGDVMEERQTIQAIIHRWNSVNSEDRATVLMPIMWETHSTPAMGDRPQAVINRQVLARCDLLIAVFWTRLGSPTGSSPSGTVEEIQAHLNAGKPAMIYFAKKPVVPDSIDPVQYGALMAFRKECVETGLVAEYQTLAEFNDKFSQHLARTLIDRFSGPSSEDAERVFVSAVSSPPQISDDAVRMLIAAADSTGQIFRISTMGGTLIHAGQQVMTKQGDRRDEARWESALRELQGQSLVEEQGTAGELFTVTHAGYGLVDSLKSRASANPPQS